MDCTQACELAPTNTLFCSTQGLDAAAPEPLLRAALVAAFSKAGEVVQVRHVRVSGWRAGVGHMGRWCCAGVLVSLEGGIWG